MQIFISFYDFFIQNQREFDIKNQKRQSLLDCLFQAGNVYIYD